MPETETTETTLLHELSMAANDHGIRSPKAAVAARALAEHYLSEYKQRVLTVATAAKQDENWCDEGFAQALADLDIEPPTREYVVLVDLEVTRSVEVKVEAISADAAQSAVESDWLDSDMCKHVDWVREDDNLSWSATDAWEAPAP